MLVADVHERVPAVREPESARCRLGQANRIAVSVWELEVRPQHQRAVRAPFDSHVFAEALTQEFPQGVDVERHGNSLG